MSNKENTAASPQATGKEDPLDTLAKAIETTLVVTYAKPLPVKPPKRYPILNMPKEIQTEILSYLGFKDQISASDTFPLWRDILEAKLFQENRYLSAEDGCEPENIGIHRLIRPGPGYFLRAEVDNGEIQELAIICEDTESGEEDLESFDAWYNPLPFSDECLFSKKLARGMYTLETTKKNVAIEINGVSWVTDRYLESVPLNDMTLLFMRADCQDAHILLCFPILTKAKPQITVEEFLIETVKNLHEVMLRQVYRSLQISPETHYTLEYFADWKMVNKWAHDINTVEAAYFNGLGFKIILWGMSDEEMGEALEAWEPSIYFLGRHRL
ncbi:hypothetical protein TWF281_007005 [Arthrobotrys megalospora]